MFIITAITIIYLSWVTQGAVIPEDQINAPSVSIPSTYLSLVPILVTQQDSVTHELLRQLITSVNLKHKESPSISWDQKKVTNSSNAVKLVDIGDGQKVHIVAVKRVNWFNAMELCKFVGMQLISLQTKEKSLRL